MSWLERLVDALRDGLTEEQWAAIESKVESERRKHAEELAARHPVCAAIMGRWRKDSDGDWVYGKPKSLKAVVGQLPTGLWYATTTVGAHDLPTEQSALDWASAKLGVEAPSGERRDRVLSPADKQILKNLKEMAELWEEIRGEKPAAGPWKAWPENKPTDRTCLVRIKNGSITLAQLASPYSNGPTWIHPIQASPVLGGVTHFAELNTEGAP